MDCFCRKFKNITVYILNTSVQVSKFILLMTVKSCVKWGRVNRFLSTVGILPGAEWGLLVVQDNYFD